MMNINELENFSIDELSHLTIEELEISAKELIEKLRDDNRELPFSAVEKLQEICAPLPDEAPKIKGGMTRAEICMLLTFMITYMTNLPEIAQKWAPIFQAVIEFLAEQVN